MRIRAKDNHPFLKKLDALFQYMEDNGIHFRVPMSNVSQLRVFNEENGEEWEIIDIDNEDYSMTTIPPAFEFKLCREKTESKVKE